MGPLGEEPWDETSVLTEGNLQEASMQVRTQEKTASMTQETFFKH